MSEKNYVFGGFLHKNVFHFFFQFIVSFLQYDVYQTLSSFVYKNVFILFFFVLFCE